MSFLSPEPMSSIRTIPSRAVADSAESTMMLHSVEPFPLAGDTVIQGSWVLATHCCGDSRAMVLVPPQAGISTEFASSSKLISSGCTQESAPNVAMAEYTAIFMILCPISIQSYVFAGTYVLSLVIYEVIKSVGVSGADIAGIENDFRVVADIEEIDESGDGIRNLSEIVGTDVESSQTLVVVKSGRPL